MWHLLKAFLKYLNGDFTLWIILLMPVCSVSQQLCMKPLGRTKGVCCMVSIYVRPQWENHFLIQVPRRTHRERTAALFGRYYTVRLYAALWSRRNIPSIHSKEQLRVLQESWLQQKQIMMMPVCADGVRLPTTSDCRGVLLLNYTSPLSLYWQHAAANK